MSSHENQKKGVMYVYKLDTGGGHHHPQTPPPSMNKKVVSRSWGLLKRSKTYRENEINQQHYDKEDKKEMVHQESARKSVSVMEGGRKLMESAGRRSVGNAAEMSLGNAAPMAALMQIRVLVTDMPAFMQIHAFRCARQTFDSLEKFSSKQIALNLKKEFDKVYGPAWHCIVGSNFGSFVTHATGPHGVYPNRIVWLLNRTKPHQETLYSLLSVWFLPNKFFRDTLQLALMIKGGDHDFFP